MCTPLDKAAEEDASCAENTLVSIPANFNMSLIQWAILWEMTGLWGLTYDSRRIIISLVKLKSPSLVLFEALYYSQERVFWEGTKETLFRRGSQLSFLDQGSQLEQNAFWLEDSVSQI